MLINLDRNFTYLVNKKGETKTHPSITDPAQIIAGKSWHDYNQPLSPSTPPTTFSAVGSDALEFQPSLSHTDLQNLDPQAWVLPFYLI